MDEKRLEDLRSRVKNYKTRSKLNYRAVAEQIGIPFSSLRNFIYGARISIERYHMMVENIEVMEAQLPW